MGKYRFKLSNMMPNAWFYKLKDMGKGRSMKPNVRSSKTVKPSSSPTKTQTRITNTSTTNNSKHPKSSTEPLIRFTDPLYSSPRNNSRNSDARSSVSLSRMPSHVHTHTRNKRKKMYRQKNDSFCSADQPIYYSLSSGGIGSPEYVSMPNDGIRKGGDFGVELVMFDELGSWSSSSLRSSSSCCCRISSSTADIIIDLNHHDNQNHAEANISKKFQQLYEFDAASELELRPIVTKLPTEAIVDKVDTSEFCNRKSAAVSNELHRIGANNKYIQRFKSRRASLSDSFAIVMSSIDPQRDFKESMMEMILENNLRGVQELENLLACYLSLNCKEYHPLIVNAFEQIWLDVFCST